MVLTAFVPAPTYFIRDPGRVSGTVRPFVLPRRHSNDGGRLLVDSAQTIVISRFILNLRRSDQKNRAVETQFSLFTSPAIQVPTRELVNDMGQPLAYENSAADDVTGFGAGQHSGERDDWAAE